MENVIRFFILIEKENLQQKVLNFTQLKPQSGREGINWIEIRIRIKFNIFSHVADHAMWRKCKEKGLASNNVNFLPLVPSLASKATIVETINQVQNVCAI